MAIVSFLSLVLGELVPKSLGLRFSEPYALTMAKPLSWLAQITRPLIWGLTTTSNLFLRLFGDETSFTEAHLSREELTVLVREATTHGTLDREAGEIAARAFDFGRLSAGDVMVGRNHALFLDVRADATTIQRLLTEHRHQRYPVIEGTVDNIVGYVRTSDVTAQVIAGEKLDLAPLLRKPVFVPESMTAGDVLRSADDRRRICSLIS